MKHSLISFISLASLNHCTWLLETYQNFSGSKNLSKEETSIHVGVVLPLSGIYAAFGEECQTSFDLAYEKVDPEFQKKLKITIEDSMSTAQGAAQAGNKLVHSGSHVIYGEVVSQTSLALSSVTERWDIPVINPGATNIKLTDYKNTLRVCFDDNFQAMAWGRYIHDVLGGQTISLLVNIDSDYSVGAAEAVANQFIQQGGTVLGRVTYQDSDYKHANQIQQLVALKADYVVAPGDYQRIGGILRQVRELAPELKLLGTDSWHQGQLPALSDGATEKGYLITTHFSSDEPVERVQYFVEAFKAKRGYLPGQVGAICYDGANLMFQRLASYNGDLKDKKTFMAHMLDDHEFCGLPGCFQFKNRNPIKPVYIIKTTRDGFVFHDKIDTQKLLTWFSKP